MAFPDVLSQTLGRAHQGPLREKERCPLLSAPGPPDSVSYKESRSHMLEKGNEMKQPQTWPPMQWVDVGKVFFCSPCRAHRLFNRVTAMISPLCLSHYLSQVL